MSNEESHAAGSGEVADPGATAWVGSAEGRFVLGRFIVEDRDENGLVLCVVTPIPAGLDAEKHQLKTPPIMFDRTPADEIVVPGRWWQLMFENVSADAAAPAEMRQMAATVAATTICSDVLLPADSDTVEIVCPQRIFVTTCAAREAGAVVVAHRSSGRRAVRGRIADRPARGCRDPRRGLRDHLRGTRGMGPHGLIADDDRPSLNELELGGALSRPTPIAKWPWRTLALHPSLFITDFTMPCLNELEVWGVLRRDYPREAGRGRAVANFVAKAVAPETGHLASRGLARPKPPASQTPLPERPIWRMS